MGFTLKEPLSLYWKCQLIGWTLAGMYWQLDGLSMGGYDPFFGLVQLASDVLMYIALTHAYRHFALGWGWTAMAVDKLLFRILPAIVVMGIFYCALTLGKIYGLRVVFSQTHGQSFDVFLLQNYKAVLVGGVRMMGIWLLAYHLYQYAQGQIRLARLNAELEGLSRQAQLDNLSAQLNPHFLFNSLNTIKSLVIEDPLRARRGIDLLAELLRGGLYPREGKMVSLADELALVKDYLELEGLRLEERLQVELDIDESLLGVFLPHFAIQTLVENAIKHGVTKKKGGGTVSLSVARVAGEMAIKVSSPGELVAGHSTGIGLANLRQRLQLAYGETASLKLSGVERGNVNGVLLIPIL